MLIIDLLMVYIVIPITKKLCPGGSNRITYQIARSAEFQKNFSFLVLWQVSFSPNKLHLSICLWLWSLIK